MYNTEPLISINPYLHVLGLWEEAEVPEENKQRKRESIQKPHREAPGRPQFTLVRQQCKPLKFQMNAHVLFIVRVTVAVFFSQSTNKRLHENSTVLITQR